ncbi:MAG TPA: Asp-tRNA(Asn)/Glu-tRNA(Gln) amidotransferase subunit GatC [Beutenbergiaceae bacterium]|nr:Asp-tRNA(Asn)/Glu-tRNA(Gln) amidotransferase subunit GatC [Beutenbergiaceae bacterium]
MPKMNPEEVARIAKLALIDLTEEEVEKFAGELDVIIDAVEVVSGAVSEDTPATSHPLPLSNVFREDVPGETLPTDVVLAAAPEAEDGRFAVPQILGEDA